MSWKDGRGLWVRFVMWLCRRGSRRAQEYAVGELGREIDEERMGALLSACWNSGKPVFATEDENGRLVIRIDGEEDRSVP